MSDKKMRFFEVQPDRVVIPPRDVIAGPGARHNRYFAGDVLEVPAKKVGRFIRGRVAAGDLVEVKEAKPTKTPAAPPEPRARSGKELDLAAAAKKEG